MTDKFMTTLGLLLLKWDIQGRLQFSAAGITALNKHFLHVSNGI